MTDPRFGRGGERVNPYDPVNPQGSAPAYGQPAGGTSQGPMSPQYGSAQAAPLYGSQQAMPQYGGAQAIPPYQAPQYTGQQSATPQGQGFPYAAGMQQNPSLMGTAPQDPYPGAMQTPAMGSGTPEQAMDSQAFGEDRSGFDYVPTGRGPKASLRWWHYLIIGAVALGIVAFAVVSLIPKRATTAVIRQASLGEEYTGDGLIVRDESVYDAEGVTRVEYVAAEGQVVRYNAEICRVFASGYSTKNMESLQSARDQIRTYQRTLLTSETTIEGQRYVTESNVLQSVRQIRDIIGGARGNLINQEQLLTAAVRDRQTYIKNTYANDQRLTRLLEDANVQEQYIDSLTRRCKAIEECIVSFYVDGYEYGLTMDNYASFEPGQVRSMIDGQKPELTTTQRGRTAIYRTVRDNTWSVLMLADDRTWNPVEGQQFQMRLDTFSEDESVIATVESYRRSGGELLVVLTVDSGVSDVLDLRQTRVTLYDENTALIVPSRAIYVQDEMEGVVVRTTSGDIFVPIIVIRSSGDDVYIEPVTEGFLFEGLTVRLF